MRLSVRPLAFVVQEVLFKSPVSIQRSHESRSNETELSFVAFFADLDGKMTAANLAFGDLSGASLVSKLVWGQFVRFECQSQTSQ